MLGSGTVLQTADLWNEDLRKADDIIIMPRKFIKKLVFFVLFACSAVALYLVLFANHKGNVNAEWNAIIERLKVEAASYETTNGRENRRHKGGDLNNEGNVGPPPLMVDSVGDKRPAAARHDEEYDYDVERESGREQKLRNRGHAHQKIEGRFRGDSDKDNDGRDRGDVELEAADTNRNDERERQDVIVDQLKEDDGADAAGGVKADKPKAHAIPPMEFLITNEQGDVVGEKLFAGGINHLLKKRPLAGEGKRVGDQDKGDGHARVREGVGEDGRLRNEDLLKDVPRGKIDLNKNLNTDGDDALDQNGGLPRLPNEPSLLNERNQNVADQPEHKTEAFGRDGADKKWESKAFENGNTEDNNNKNGFVKDTNTNLQANNANPKNAHNGAFNESGVPQKYVPYSQRNGVLAKQLQQDQPPAANGENPVDIRGNPQQEIGANQQIPDQNALAGTIDPLVLQQQTNQLLQKLKGLPPQMLAAILKQQKDLIMQGQGLHQPIGKDARPEIPQNENERGQINPINDPQKFNPEFQNQGAINLKNLPPDVLAKVLKQQQEQAQQTQKVPSAQAGNGDAQLLLQRDNIEQRKQNRANAGHVPQQEHLFIEDLSVPLPMKVNCVQFSFPTGNAPLCIHQEGKDPDMSSKIATNGSYEKDIMNQFTHILLSDPTLGFIDIGSGIGVYTIAAALLSRQVLSVEPLFRNYRLIHKSALENNVFSKIVLVTMALDNESYVGHLSYTETGGYSNVLIIRLTQNMIQDRANVVHVTTLNNLVQALPMKRALMKLDVSDGLEDRILQAADQFFNAVTVPHIITHWSRSAEPAKHDALYARLTGLGYQPKQAWNGALVNREFLNNDVSFVVWSQ